MASEILGRDQNHVPVVGGVTNNAAQEVRALRIDPTTGRILISATGILASVNVFNVKDYGALVDGVTDDTTAVNAAITAAVAAGGGEIYFPIGTTLCSGAIVIPYTGTSAPTQAPLRFTGVAATWNGQWGAPPSGGSIIDMRYAGGGTTVAKIDTRGLGILEIDHVVLKSGGSDNYQIMQTTNTTVFVHDCAIWGNNANNGTTCTQDFLLLGGSGLTIGNNASDAPFQGYGSKIQNNFYHKIQRAVTFGNDCNGVEIQNETFSTSCGSALAQGAPYYFNPVLGHGCFGNRIIGGTVEVVNYPYTVTCLTQTRLNSFIGIGSYDPTATTLGHYYFDTSCGFNTVYVGYADTTKTLLNGGTATTQTVIDARTGQSTLLNSLVMTATIPSITFTTTAGGAKSFKWASAYNDATSISLVDITASNAQRIIVNTTGQIGFGVNPSEMLHVKSGNVTGIRIESTGSSNLLDFYNAGSMNFSVRTNYNATGLEFLRSTSGGGAPTSSMAMFDSSGRLGIGTFSPDASSLLDLTSTTKGFLPPRMTTTQRDAISSPLEGLVIYNTSTHKLNVRVAAAWEAVTSA